jgi:phenylacetic acid degradation operon negative regulatory protein
MTEALSPPARRLLARFRRQRPMRAGSLIVTIFGDAVAPHGGAITLGSLIRLAAPFGASERLVRTSVGRLAQDGWLASRRNGRTSEYAITAAGKRRFAEATQRIYAASPERWTGRWTLLLVPVEGPGRERLRDELRWLGFGQLSPGLFAHPTRGVEDVREQLRDLESPTAGVALFQAKGGDLASDRRLAATGWDLAQLERRYRKFVADFAPVPGSAGAAAFDPESAFVVRTLLIHEYRKIHLRDPLLPHDLLPADWIGRAAYELCRDLYARVFEQAERHFAFVAARTRGNMPPLHEGTYARFGGLARTGSIRSIAPVERRMPAGSGSPGTRPSRGDRSSG